MFTGNRDIDRFILLLIDDDVTFLNLCKTNKYLSDFCESKIYKEKLSRKYPNLKKKPEDILWRQFYLKTIYYIKKLKKDYGFIFNETGIDPEMYYKIIGDSSEGIGILYGIGSWGFYDPNFIKYAFDNEGIYKFDDENFEIIKAFSIADDPEIQKKNLQVIKTIAKKAPNLNLDKILDTAKAHENRELFEFIIDYNRKQNT